MSDVSLQLNPVIKFKLLVRLYIVFFTSTPLNVESTSTGPLVVVVVVIGIALVVVDIVGVTGCGVVVSTGVIVVVVVDIVGVTGCGVVVSTGVIVVVVVDIVGVTGCGVVVSTVVVVVVVGEGTSIKERILERASMKLLILVVFPIPSWPWIFCPDTQRVPFDMSARE